MFLLDIYVLFESIHTHTHTHTHTYVWGCSFLFQRVVVLWHKVNSISAIFFSRTDFQTKHHTGINEAAHAVATWTDIFIAVNKWGNNW